MKTLLNKLKKRKCTSKPAGIVTIEFICMFFFIFVLFLMCLEMVIASVRYGQNYYATFQMGRALAVDSDALGRHGVLLENMRIEVNRWAPVDLNIKEVESKNRTVFGGISIGWINVTQSFLQSIGDRLGINTLSSLFNKFGSWIASHFDVLKLYNYNETFLTVEPDKQKLWTGMADGVLNKPITISVLHETRHGFNIRAERDGILDKILNWIKGTDNPEWQGSWKGDSDVDGTRKDFLDDNIPAGKDVFEW